MNDQEKEDFFDELLDDFVDRKQSGEAPSISDYCKQHPEFADEIRGLFSTLSMLETAKDSTIQSLDTKRSSPQKIGEYTIVREIGRGGMGVVYEARHEALDRRVALKILQRRFCNDVRILARFHREARAVARLHHTHIVPLFEVGNDDGHFYLAMQLIEGRSLDHVINDSTGSEIACLAETQSLHFNAQPTNDNGLTWSEPTPVSGFSISTASGTSQSFRWIARIGAQAADALAYAHERGIIHRDIKPSNILLDQSGVIWLTDFGLAKTEDDDLTQTGDVIGTLRYMSPEQFSESYDHRADVYALGMTLYELLTLQPAFKQPDRAQLLNMIQNSEPPKPRARNPRIPLDLETIVLRAICKDPAARYASAKELAIDLRLFVEDRPIKARRQSMVERLYRWSRRNKPLATSLAVLGAVLLLAAIGSVLTASHFRTLANEKDKLANRNRSLAVDMESQRDEAVLAQNDAEQQRRLANVNAETNKQNLYFAEMHLAASAIDMPGGIRRVRDLLDNWIPQDSQIDRRGPEWHYLNGLGRGELLNLVGHKGGVVAVAYDPSGKRIASSGDDGTVRIWDANDGRQLHELSAYQGEPPKSRKHDLAWSPDGKMLATTGSDNTVLCWEANTGQRIATLKGHKLPVRCVAFSPDGQRLATGGEDGIRVWQMSGADPNVVDFARNPEAKRNSGESHYGKLVTADRPKAIAMRPSAVLNVDAERDLINGIDWHPDGKRLASISQSSLIAVWDATTGKLDPEFEWIQNLPVLEYWFGNGSICWNPAGDQLMAAGNPIVILTAPSKKYPNGGREFAHGQGYVAKACWTTDAKHIITAGENLEVIVWDALSEQQVLRLSGHLQGVVDYEVSPQGDRLVSGSRDGSIKVWEFMSADREPLWAAGSFQFSPDGRFIAMAGGDRQQIVIANSKTKEIVQRFDPPGDSWQGFVEWSPNGDKIATGFGNGEVNSLVYVWDVETAELKKTLDVSAAFIQAIAWHPREENLIAVADNNGKVIEFWNIETGKKVSSIDTVSPWLWDTLDWSSDGKSLAVASWTSFVVAWPDLSSTQTLDGHQQHICKAVFSADDRLLATTSEDSTAIVYDTTTWQQQVRLEGHTGFVLSAAWNPDSTRLATASTDGTLRLWDIATGREAMSLDLGESNPREMEWSSDGKRIAIEINKQVRILEMSASK